MARRMVHGAFAVLVCAFTLALAGCAGSSGHQSDGSYVLDKFETTMDCQRLSNTLWGHVQLAKALPAKAQAERKTVAPTAALAWGRLFGSNKGLVAVGEYDRERAHVRSLHRGLIQKGCPPVDVEKELAESDTLIAELRKN